MTKMSSAYAWLNGTDDPPEIFGGFRRARLQFDQLGMTASARIGEFAGQTWALKLGATSRSVWLMFAPERSQAGVERVRLEQRRRTLVRTNAIYMQMGAAILEEYRLHRQNVGFHATDRQALALARASLRASNEAEFAGHCIYKHGQEVKLRVQMCEDDDGRRPIRDEGPSDTLSIRIPLVPLDAEGIHWSREALSRPRTPEKPRRSPTAE